MHQDCIMVSTAVVEPVSNQGGLLVAHFPEQSEGCIVSGIDEGEELVQVKHLHGIVGNGRQHTAAITLATESVKDDQSNLRTAIAGIEIDDIDDAHNLTNLILHHHTDLTIDVDII